CAGRKWHGGGGAAPGPHGPTGRLRGGRLDHHRRRPPPRGAHARARCAGAWRPADPRARLRVRAVRDEHEGRARPGLGGLPGRKAGNDPRRPRLLVGSAGPRAEPAGGRTASTHGGGTGATPCSGPFAALGGARPWVPRLQRGDGGSRGLECGTGGGRGACRRGRGGGRRHGARAGSGGGGGGGGGRRRGRVDRELRPGDHGDLGAIGGRAEGGDDGPGQRAGDGLGGGLFGGRLLGVVDDGLGFGADRRGVADPDHVEPERLQGGLRVGGLIVGACFVEHGGRYAG